KADSHTVHYGHVTDEDGSPIDEVMATLFRAPRSFTAEDVVEVSTHGGILVTQKVLERILSTGIRLANPGEFSERAYLNGRIDLVEAESIMDVIEAKSEQALKIANLGLRKETSKLIRDLKDKVLEVISGIEVHIDYPEYDDAIVMTREVIEPKTRALLKEIDELLKGSQKNRMIRDGVKTVIVGRPNVGKSSLLNALLEEDKAIVTDIAGTTRDTIEAYINIQGVTLKLVDTAGIRDSADVIERMGVMRSKRALAEAELVLLVLDQSEQLTKEDRELIESTRDKRRLIIGNKADLKRVISMSEVVPISSLTRAGIDDLERAILKVLSLEDIESREFNYLANVRHISKVEEAKRSLKDVLSSIERGMPIDMLSVDLRAAWQSLGDILGEHDPDQLLDDMFARFCLGK
ncbi:MAG: tRNA uridine-5-carboxymethylaminomethyl(34) synthesis GTPase MnmE, partial [Acholeplasmataceae bacterium]